MGHGDTLLNAVIGGIVSILVSFIPFSPVVGGAVAGYLQGGDRGDGIRVGAYAGLVAMVPLVLVVFGIGFLGLFTVVGMGPRAMGGLGLGAVFFLVALVVSALYTVGLGALGGWVGNYVKYDTDVDV